MGHRTTERELRGYLMGSKMQTGLLLILGTVVSFVGWMAIYPGDDSATAESAAKLMADPTLAKLGMLMGFGGMGAMFIGFLNISRKMAAGDGAGSSYANISAIMAMTLVVMMAIGISIEWAVTEASDATEGARLMLHSAALETPFSLGGGLLLVLLGVGIILEKNFHIIIGGLAVVAGAGFLLGNVDAVEMAGFIGWIGMMLVGLALGVQTLRSKS
jgi:hypothetical protein